MQNKSIQIIVACLGILLLGHINVSFAQKSSDQWTQWRGPQRSGLAESAMLESLESLKAFEQKWRVPLAESYSGPLVVADLVFVTETLDRKFEVVRALDRGTGALVWEQRWEGAMSVPFFAKSNGDWIRSTPIYDEGRLYVGGMQDILICLNAEDGKVIWRLDCAKTMNSDEPPFGNVPSPLIDGEFLYTQAGNSLVKIKKQDGTVVWKAFEQSKGMMTAGAFSSPIIATLHGNKQVIVQSRTALGGIDVESGTVLWQQEIPSFRGMNILTPTVIENQVYTSSYQGGGYLFDINQEAGKWNAKEVWHNRLEGYMSSPVIVDGFIYLHMRNQRFACIDLKDGSERWTSKPYGKYWSMVTRGNRILALDESGELLLIQADPSEFKLLDQRKIAKQPTWAHIGIVGDEIFIRELKAMSVFRLNKDRKFVEE